ncbi:DUF5050 domain-containing protein [Paenibacillus methanolicus]|uniref:Uncharacterized protein DUF5050 n=1 Tax=Paenibacillus methanolicus TaxID=582686 RepID=A0A5S5BP25_9BACL|nr:DUF5050 domain-containing protein [Paenibacillus methanolicus]TYP68945.1 uncharacterized protein DUF5050 [Paenibacillus methanolicus]
MRWKKCTAALLAAVAFMGPIAAGHDAVTAAAGAQSQASNPNASGKQLASALAELSEYNLIGVTADGWIYVDEYYFEPGTYRQQYRVLKKKAGDSALQDATKDKLIRPSAPSRQFAVPDQIDYNIRAAATAGPYLRNLAAKSNVHILSIAGETVLYWEGEIARDDYGDERLSKGVIKRAKLDGTSVNVVVSDPGTLQLSHMTVANQTLYYTVANAAAKPSANPGEAAIVYSLYRIGLDGKNKKLLAGDYLGGVDRMNRTVRGIALHRAYQQSVPVQIWNGNIVYQATTGMYKMKTDGTGKTRLAADHPVRPILDGDAIYYGTKRIVPGTKKRTDELGPIYQVKLSGGKPVPLTKGGSKLLFAKDGWAYTESDPDELDQRLTRIKPGTGSQSLINGLKGSESFAVTHVYGDLILYGKYSHRSNRTYHAMNWDGSGKKEILVLRTNAYPDPVSGGQTLDAEEAIRLNYGKYEMPAELKRVLKLQEDLREKKLLDYGDMFGVYFYEDGVDSRYLNTPLDVITFGSPGVDGIHYGFLTDFGEVTSLEEAYIVRVEPMNFDDPVRIVARNLHDFLRMLVYAENAAHVLDMNADKASVSTIMAPDPDAWEPGRDDALVRHLVSQTLKLEKMPDPYAYFQQLKKARGLAATVPTEDGLGVVPSTGAGIPAERFDFAGKEWLELADAKAFFGSAPREAKLVFLRDAQSRGWINEADEDVKQFLKQELRAIGLDDEADRIGYPDYEDYYEEGYTEKETDWMEIESEDDEYLGSISIDWFSW